jgi:hypothetical protein
MIDYAEIMRDRLRFSLISARKACDDISVADCLRPHLMTN